MGAPRKTAWPTAVSLLTLAVISLLMHYPRIFFVADQSAAATGQASLAATYPALCKWDCPYYHYLAAPADPSADPHAAAFFPLFPLVLAGAHALAPALSLDALSVLVSNLFSLAAVALLILLGSALWKGDDDPPELRGWNRSGLLLGLAIATYPFSEFGSFGYPESLFVLLFAGAVLGIARGRWSAAALCAGLASVTRPQGIWLLGAFGVLAGLRAWRERRLPFVAALAALPFAAFLVWQWREFGSAFAFLHVQTAIWHRSFDLLAGLSNNLPRYDLSRIFNWLALYAAYRFARRPGDEWKLLAAMAFLMTEIPLFFGGFFSYPRFSALNLGVFAMLVELSRRRPWLVLALLLFALTRLSVEIHTWITSPFFAF